MIPPRAAQVEFSLGRFFFCQNRLSGSGKMLGDPLGFKRNIWLQVLDLGFGHCRPFIFTQKAKNKTGGTSCGKKAGSNSTQCSLTPHAFS
jgi:hypothetical protein